MFKNNTKRAVMERLILFVIGTFIASTSLIFIQRAESKASPSISVKVEIQSDKLNRAIELLGKHPEYKKYVESHIKIIRHGKLTRIVLENGFVVEMTQKFIDGNTIPWIASTFVHEARHAQQIISGMKMTDQMHELDANRIQLDALKLMGGSDKNVAWLSAHNGMHFDTNGNGILDKDDNWGW
jgi:hypothetical protein